MSRRTIAGIVAFGLAAVCLAVTLLTFPWHEGDAVSAAYVVAINRVATVTRMRGMYA